VALFAKVFEKDREAVKSNVSTTSLKWGIAVPCAMYKKPWEHNAVLRVVCDILTCYWDTSAKLVWSGLILVVLIPLPCNLNFIIQIGTD
jgi:hypothetical protein